MRFRGILSSAAAIAAATLLCAGGAWATVTCTATGFYVDGMNMTAASINPGSLSNTTVDATGCNIGIYFDDGTDGGPVGGTLNAVTVSGGPNYFGVVANGGGGANPVVVNVTNSTIANVAENPLNGAQHGNAIFYINGSTDTSKDDSRTCSTASTASTTGIVSGNSVTGYQKNGITVKCPGVSVAISGNTVTGAGETTAIAQNGIELGVGALGTITNNSVSENEYTGLNGASSSGVIVFGGGPYGALAVKEHVNNNILTDNDVGIFSFNCGDNTCSTPPKVPTSNIISGNSLSNSDVSNVSGCGGSEGYQAGISDLGRNDQISKNAIGGAGYTFNNQICDGQGNTPALFAIDNTGSKSKTHKNVSP